MKACFYPLRRILDPSIVHKILLLFLLVGFCQFGLAQDLVSMKNGPPLSKQEEPVEKQKALSQALRELETRYQISFIYENKLVDGKFVENDDLGKDGLAEKLNTLLPQFGLKYKKIGKRIYSIGPGKAKEPKQIPTLLHKGESNSNVVDTKELTISGRITNETGEGMAGVTVVLKGSTVGTSADAEGNYTLTVPDGNGILVFSFIGYLSQEVPINNRTTINVSLALDAKALDEVVVVGYGVQRKVTQTGSVVSAKGDDVRQSPATNLTNSLVGRLPGLTALASSGEPGRDGSTIRIRGSNTLGDNNPLIVVDGIPNRPMERINPADIESVTVLKDASAAIYGAQAANGVILITTKRGKTGKPRITIDISSGINQPTRIPEMANAAEYTTMLNEIAFYRNESLGRFQKYSAEDIQKYSDGSDPWGYPNTNWFKEVFKPYARQNYQNASISGGSENLKYFVSMGARTQDGIYKGSANKYSDYNFRSNIDGKISNNITISVDVAGRQEVKDFAVVGVGSIFRSLLRGKPFAPAYWPDGTPGPSLLEFGDQPAVTSTKAPGYDKNKLYRLETNVKTFITIPWVKGLSIQANASFDKSSNFHKRFAKPWYLYSWDGNADHKTVPGKVGLEAPTLSQDVTDGQRIVLNAYATYDRTILENHNAKIMVGTESQRGSSDFFSAYRQNFISSEIDQLFAGANNQYMTNTGSGSQNARMSYFGRVNYDYSQKYLLEFIWRYDGSYIFAPGKQFGFFPGISGGWRISEENFWKNNINFLDDFKLRASWGQTGNDRINEFQYLSSFGFLQNRSYVFGVNNQAPVLDELRIPNPNVTWEVATQSNFGFDAQLLNNKLSVEADYFTNMRSNILWWRNASVPGYSGLTLPRENIGKVSNRGFEAAVSYRNQIREFIYEVSVNGSYAKNKIVFWDETPGIPEYQQSTGRPMGSNLYYNAIGVFEDQAAVDAYPHWPGARPGDIIFEDYNSDGKIDGLDMVRNEKDYFPRFIGGANINLQYKQFDIAMLIQGTAGGTQKYVTLEAGETGNYYKEWAVNRWTPENPNTTYPRAWDFQTEYWATQPNTYWLIPMDYVRLKNIEIGYNLPVKFNQIIGIEGFRIYLNGLNLLTMSKSKLVDPEVAGGQTYPLSRVVNAGLTLTF